jgi:autotransporter-associated beta strand protein
VFAPALSGNGTVNALAGTTIFTGANTYSGATNVNAGTLRAGALNTFSSSSAVTVASGGTLDLNGFSQTASSLTNAGLVNMGTGTAPGTVLTTTSYIGTGGTIAMNTFLGGDGSPSDKLIVNGGSATGNSFLRITNVGGPGAGTVANGIAVVQAINGGTTLPGAFALAGELRAGAFDYDLFRGGLGGSSPNDWFLRSSFTVGPPIMPPEPPILPPEPPPQPRCRQASIRSSGRRSRPTASCNRSPGNWGLRSSARSTTGSATPTSQLQLRPQRSLQGYLKKAGKKL